MKRAGQRAIGPRGRCAPLMSPGTGCARASSLTSLCTTPPRPDPAPLKWFDAFNERYMAAGGGWAAQ